MVRKIKAKLVLQLGNQGLSGRAIASAQGMARESQRDGSEAVKSSRLCVLPRRSGHALSGCSSRVAVSSAAVCGRSSRAST